MPEFCVAQHCWQSPAVLDQVPAWDALAACASQPNPFFESWFLLPSLNALDPEGQVSLLCFHADGLLAGLLPVRRANRYYGWPLPHWQTWLHANAFIGAPLVARGLEREFWKALLDWADSHAGAGLFLHLDALPLEGALHDALIAQLAEREGPSALVHQIDRPMLSSPLDAEAYYASALSSKERGELRRKQARLAELGAVRIDRQTGCDGIEIWIAQFLELEASGWKGKAQSAMASAPQTALLLQETLRSAAQLGRLDRLSLLLDDRPIAMLTSLRAPPGAFGYKSAFDESYGRFSPGMLLLRETLSALDDPALSWFDSCTSPDNGAVQRLWAQRRQIGRYSIGIGGPLRRRLYAAIQRAELRNSQVPAA